MIAYLKGKVLFKGENFLIVDVNGTGYKVFVSRKTFEQAEEDSLIELFVFSYLKRETIELYGCSGQKEFKLFETLEKMPGIGPKTAISLAGFGSPEELVKAIEQKDEKPSPLLKGIGKKRIQRLFLELTGKIKEGGKQKPEFSEKQEALEALLGLGFPSQRAKRVLSEMPPEIEKTEDRVEQALKILGKK